jgi:uncharacterized membrane protein
LSTEAIAYLITISSSSIDSPVTYARLACSLLYTWAKMPYKTIKPKGRLFLEGGSNITALANCRRLLVNYRYVIVKCGYITVGLYITSSSTSILPLSFL